MKKILIAIAVLGLAACGGSDGGTPDVSAPGEEGSMASQAADSASSLMKQATETAKGAVTVDPKVSSCLELVKEGKFAEAIAPCTEAVGVDPENNEVKQALDKAKQEAAQAKVDEATQKAADEANKAIGDALKGYGTKSE